jgi:hypothetical protein
VTLHQLTVDTSARESWPWWIFALLVLAMLAGAVFVEPRLKKRRDYWYWTTVSLGAFSVVWLVWALLTDVTQLGVLAGAAVGAVIGTQVGRCACCGARARGGALNRPWNCIECGAPPVRLPGPQSFAPFTDRAAFLESTIHEQVALDHAEQRREANSLRSSIDRIAERFERRRRVRFAKGVQSIAPRDAREKLAAWVESRADDPAGTPNAADASAKGGTDSTSDSLRRRFGRAGVWQLVCEEFVDRAHAPQERDLVRAELQRRGLSDADVHAMRALAHRTVGWTQAVLNVSKWISLDEHDMRRALDFQLAWELIDANEYRRSTAFVRDMLRRRTTRTS